MSPSSVQKACPGHRQGVPESRRPAAFHLRFLGKALSAKQSGFEGGLGLLISCDLLLSSAGITMDFVGTSLATEKNSLTDHR